MADYNPYAKENGSKVAQISQSLSGVQDKLSPDNNPPVPVAATFIDDGVIANPTISGLTATIVSPAGGVAGYLKITAVAGSAASILFQKFNRINAVLTGGAAGVSTVLSSIKTTYSAGVDYEWRIFSISNADFLAGSLAIGASSYASISRLSISFLGCNDA